VIANTRSSIFALPPQNCGKRLVADQRVLLVLHEVERSGADRFLIDLFGVPALSIASAYSFDCTPAYSIARFDRNGASALLSVILTV
jgi:hypothetical protein